MRNLWDFAWQAPDPDAFVAYDVDAASYCGAAEQPSDYYAALRARGVDVLGIMETVSTASQGGYNAGVNFVQFARPRWRAVGFDDSAPIAYAASDGSAYDPNYGWDNIAAWGEAIGDYEVGPFKFYGNRYAVDAACSGAARSMHPGLCLNLSGGWLPRTWGFDETRDTAAQEIGGAPLAGIDVNTVYRPIFGPVTPTPTTTTKGALMFLTFIHGDGFWVKNNQAWVLGPKYAKRVDIDVNGNPLDFATVLNHWAHLPVQGGGISFTEADQFVTDAVQQVVRDKKLDKQLASVTLP